MDDKKDLLTNIDHRFNRVTGQIKAIQKSIQDKPDTDCIDVVYQIKATRNALKKISQLLIEQKIKKSVDIHSAKMQNLKEALEILSREY